MNARFPTSFGKAVLAAALALVLVAVAASAGSGDEPAAILPDLTVQPPDDVNVRRVGGRFQLGFESAADNAGEGPLTVHGRRLRPDARTMAATQLVEHVDGSVSRHALAARLRYVRSADHSHWHYLGFMRYTLRNPRTGRAVARDRKTGFCLGDRYQTDSERDDALPPEAPRYRDSDCGKGQPRATSVEEGISAGWGDDYRAYLEGQSIDITRLRAGRYLLVHKVEPDRTLRELSHTNNASSALIRISRPRGGGRRVKVLARCRQSARCRR